MKNTPGWWDNFWNSQNMPLRDGGGEETWYDLVWEFACEYWRDLFGRKAPGQEILECGCGSARISRYLAERGYRCTLLDYSESALTAARANFETACLKSRYVISDIHHLSIRDRQFDVVFSGGVLEFLPDVGQAIREMVRVLKPGGIFAANMVPRKFSIQVIADVERTMVHSIRNILMGRFRKACRRVQNLPSDYPVNNLKLGDYVTLCEKAGLSHVYARVTSPFPVLTLPNFGKRFYVNLIKGSIPAWKRFNESQRRWTSIWGITYTVYGFKDAKD